MATVYHINKGINKPIEFKGLKAQYILYLGIGLVFLLLLFAILYTLKLHLALCIIIVGLFSMALITMVYKLSREFGQYGMLKFIAKHKIPQFLSSSSRNVFLQLKSKGGKNG
jgi:hypothetical protein